MQYGLLAVLSMNALSKYISKTELSFFVQNPEAEAEILHLRETPTFSAKASTKERKKERSKIEDM
jgi:hypothetical protein